MSAQPIVTRDEWQRALAAYAPGTDFLQSWEWGEFQREMGVVPVRLALQQDEVRGCVQGFKYNLPFGFYWYFPRVVLASELWSELSAWSKATKATWLHLESAEKTPEKIASVSPSRVRAANPRQPEASWCLDLHQSSAGLLAHMHAKTRYNINLAERKGVVVEAGAVPEIFLQLMRDTTARDQFAAHAPEYYRSMLTIPYAEQLTAYHNGVPLATGIFMNYNKVYTYLHGASANVGREMMAPYALQWAGIQRGQALGVDQYDFWGIAPPASATGPVSPQESDTQTFHGYTWSTAHKLSGVTRFKAGFGGTLIEYPAAFLIVHRPTLYKSYRFLQKVKKILTI